MAGRHTVVVATFGRSGSFAITLPYPTHARALKEAIGQKLGLKPDSFPVFSVFEGPLGRPTRLFRDDDSIRQGAENLSLQKWCFDVQQEAKLVRHDDVAIHLLFSEATSLLDRGLLHPSDAEQQELDSFSDPTFPTERQFLELARTVKGYTAFTAASCKLVSEVVSNDVTIASGSVVTCTADLSGLTVEGVGGQAQLEWPWHQIKRWSSPTSRLVKFEVCLMQGNAPMLQWMRLETEQSYSLMCAASTVCHILKDEEAAALAPVHPPKRGLPGRPIDPLLEFVNTELFGRIQFSSIGVKHS